MARYRPKMRRTSWWYLYIYLLMMRSPLVSSPLDASTPWNKSSLLYARHHRFCPIERTFDIPWKNVQRWLKSFCDSYYEQSNSTRAAWLSFSILTHMLGAAPIKVHFYDAYIIPVLIRSTFWHWNNFWGALILETLWYLQNEWMLSSYVSQ